MFVLARRHKEMKKHMRELNWSNGNVFEKVKKLKVELKKVQQDHDKDPHNARLREEEMIYTNVYKESVLDEEKVLKQKTKVECLREGDHNTAYFHKKLKGRVYKSRIMTVKDEMGRAFYGDDVPAQFLDDVDALTVIKRITDEEIKAALFNIDDLLSTSVLRKTMDELSLFSGILPSMAKSTIFFGNVPEMVKENIKLVMPFSECHLPVRYLGIPLVSRNLTRGDCTILIEIVKKRIDDWRNKSLSFVGRLQLIAFILNFLHVYWAYMFILTINVCNDIEKLVKGFLWKTNGNNRGKGSVSWKDVCL
ncbi:hypothetical protein Tco_0332642 [Tanacetum coccineum]